MTPPCTFLLGALLAVLASAQFPGLPKIDPGHIAGVVKSAEKNVQTLSQKTKQNLASGVAKEVQDLRSQAPSVADNAAQSAAQTASAAAQTSEATKTVTADAQAQQQAGAFGGPPALTTAALAPAPVVSTGNHDIAHTDELLETARDQIDHSKVNQVFGDAPKNLPEGVDMALDSKDITKATDSLQDVYDIVQANKQQVENLTPKAHDLASKIIPGLNPSKVMGEVSKVVDGVSKNVEGVKPMIHKVLKSDPTNVAHASEKGGVKHVGKIDTNTVRKYINSDDPVEEEQASDVEEATERVGSHWQWSLFFIVGAVGTLFVGWKVTKRRDARSHTLISDMAGSIDGAPTHNSSRKMQSEEVLLRHL